MIINNNKLAVKKSHVNGYGLFTTRTFKRGEFIEYVHGEKVEVRSFNHKLAQASLNWIGASKYTWINTEHSPFRYINHSCEPNVEIKGERTVYALKNLASGEEITIDYSFTEADTGWSIEKCTCGSSHCRRKIGPITSLTEQQFKKVRALIPDKFAQVYKNYLKSFKH